MKFGKIVQLFLVVAVFALAQACEREEPAADVAPPPAEEAPPTDLEKARALIDQGDVPGAIEPLRRALREAPPGASRDRVELLLGQCVAATDESTAEARIGDMRQSHFEAFVESGALPAIPYFDDPGVDAYFRKVLMSMRDEAREIRARRR
jgi:hypothetical protein